MADCTVGTHEQCKMALVHVERILRVKSDLLNKPSKNRKTPRSVIPECLSSNCVSKKWGKHIVPHSSYKNRAVIIEFVTVNRK